jgi:hypothetical protein
VKDIITVLLYYCRGIFVIMSYLYLGISSDCRCYILNMAMLELGRARFPPEITE